jgi:predicted small secreted protein
MSNPRAIIVVACTLVLTACATGQSAEQDLSHADISHVANVRSTFGSDYKVTSVGPTGIDPRLLGPQALPQGMTFDPADCAQNCQKVGFTGPGVRGLVEVVEAPKIDGVHTLGTHRVLQTTVDGKPRTGELYNYIANFGTFLVIVTANPLVLPDKPVAPVNTQRARDLLTAAVAAVKG